MKTRRWLTYAVIVLVGFMILWFSGLLPKQVAKAVANRYIANQENAALYEFEQIEYSPFHDSYFVCYNLKNDPQKTRSLEIPYRYFPFWGVFSDSDDFKEN